jgi:membrane protein implicated in regulation of membrane protease activity
MLQFLQNVWLPFSSTIPANNISTTTGSKHRQRFIGEAVVSQEIGPNQKGRVCFRGSWWPASCEENIILQPGVMVKVVGIRDITLLVQSKL